MKAVTIYQPWASLIAVGTKRFETRSWETSYRGKIAIHAGVKRLGADTPLQLLKTPECLRFAFRKEDIDTIRERAKLWHNPPKDLLQFLNDKIPFGAIIATAELVGCWHINLSAGACNSDLYFFGNGGIKKSMAQEVKREILFGDFSRYRYAWELANVKVLETPIPCKGKQGLWNWDEVGYDE